MPRRVADFGGDIHDKFKEQIRKSYRLERVIVQHAKSSEGNYYLIVFLPKERENKRRWRFTAKIQQNLQYQQKSNVIRTAEKSESVNKDKRTLREPVIIEDFDYHFNCARWLCSILSEHTFEIKTLEVMLPPRCVLLQNLKWQITVKRIEITVDNEERDRLLIIGWLANFERGMVRSVQITSESLQIQLKMSEFLKSVHTVEIIGKSDIDWEWIRNTNTVKFSHIPSDDFVLTDDEIKRMCDRFIDPNWMSPNIKGQVLIFNQGTIERAENQRWAGNQR
ncbi:unnamed protein product [Caenorhabditis angaria]|uniref:Uncharacterized protein n=1 Tax=Caenorhabditis angaria TaxID=860376 RepID=A0A9P1I4I4_9PELO|nr:unnamed protein product [Caenorhabditis angaria]